MYFTDICSHLLQGDLFIKNPIDAIDALASVIFMDV